MVKRKHLRVLEAQIDIATNLSVYSHCEIVGTRIIKRFWLEAVRVRRAKLSLLPCCMWLKSHSDWLVGHQQLFAVLGNFPQTKSQLSFTALPWSIVFVELGIIPQEKKIRKKYCTHHQIPFTTQHIAVNDDKVEKSTWIRKHHPYAEFCTTYLAWDARCTWAG